MDLEVGKFGCDAGLRGSHVKYAGLGKRLRAARKRLGLSQFEIADAMGCSRAQVDNIEVARQRAPLHRIEDFAKAVGLRVLIQMVPGDVKVVSVRTTGEIARTAEDISKLDEIDRELISDLVRMMPHLPDGIRGTLRGITALWTERYSPVEGEEVKTA